MRAPVRRKLILLLLASAICGCDAPRKEPPTFRDWNVPLAIGETTLYVPRSWNRRSRNDPRPWPNGLRVDTGGWGQFQPWLGPLQAAGNYDRPRPGEPFRADISAPRPRPDHPDPFFILSVTFEFPLPPVRKRPWWASHKITDVYPWGIDQLTYSYRAPADPIERPYVAMLSDLRPGDGRDVGDGWREVLRPFDARSRNPLPDQRPKTLIKLRFDADDWREHGGTLPRRLAASFSGPFWSHFEPLSVDRWEASFTSQNLPVDQWRARHETAERLFAWMRTSPRLRDSAERFVWWTDLSSRPPTYSL